MDDIDALIEGARQESARTCKVCANEKLATVVARWQERRAAGETLPGLSPMFDRVFSKLGDASNSKIRDHIKECLGLNHKTGNPL